MNSYQPTNIGSGWERVNGLNWETRQGGVGLKKYIYTVCSNGKGKKFVMAPNTLIVKAVDSKLSCKMLGATSIFSYMACMLRNLVCLGGNRGELHDNMPIVDRFAQRALSASNSFTKNKECGFILFQVNFVCQLVRKNDGAMGGIQVVGIGDFYQLPPVKSKLNGDIGCYAFESRMWNAIFPHRVILEEVHRQSDINFIQVINETARGVLSQHSISFIHTLSSNTFSQKQNQEAIRLFPLIYDVRIYNAERLSVEEGMSKVYNSEEGKHVPKGITKLVKAPQYLDVKINAPVILVANLSDKLVNGMEGKVTYMYEDSIEVYFPSINEKHILKAHLFFKYNQRSNQDVMVRKQIPLMLSYGLTIHKCQGMTLPNVVLDCSNIFEAGQLSVALGRVKSHEDIIVTNFNPALCIPHPNEITQYYINAQMDTMSVSDVNKCCKNTHLLPSLDDEEEEEEEREEEEEDEDEEEEEEGQEEEEKEEEEKGEEEKEEEEKGEEKEEMDEDRPTIRADKLIKTTKIEKPVTKMHHDMNGLLNNLQEQKLDSWINDQVNKLQTISEHKNMTRPQEVNKVTQLFITEYGGSNDFRLSASKLFNLECLTQCALTISLQFLLQIYNDFISNISQASTSSSVAEVPVYPSLSPGGRGKIRYVGGMCVAKVIHTATKQICNRLHKEETQDTKNLKSIVKSLKTHVYNSTHIALTQTTYPDSMEEIKNRENIYGHLTSITDDLYLYFLHLDKFIFTYLHASSLQKYMNSLFDHILQNVLQDSGLQQYTPKDIPTAGVKLILIRYIRVSISELCKKLNYNLQVQKKTAHRKQIKISETPKRTLPASSTCTGTTSEPKKPRQEKSASTTHTSTSTNIHSPTPCTSTDEPHDNMCFVCGVAYTRRLQCIQCDACNKWLHRKCDKRFKNQRLWKHCSAGEMEYHCPSCHHK